MNSKKMMLIGASTIIFLLIAVVWWILSPAWSPIYPNQLSDASQNEAIDILNKQGIQYKIDSKTNQLLLRSHDLTKAQALLSANGLPKEQSSGLEIFNNSDYGLSEFAQNINYQRGMEEELSRTLRRMSGIKNARVHLTIKKESLFEERKQEPKASVVLSLKPDFLPDQEKVQGMQEVIAAAVPNLDPSKVVIITDDGKVLSAGEMDAYSKKLISLEEKYTNIVNGLLRDIFPAHDYKVSVNVLFDQKKKMTIEENIYPDLASGKGFLLRKKSSDKSSEITVDGSKSGGQTQSEEEYIYSKEKSEIVYPGGDIVKISVGLVINGSIDEKDRFAISQLIFESLGMDADRGDRVSVYVAGRAFVDSSGANPSEKEALTEGYYDQKESVGTSTKNIILAYLESNVVMLLMACVALFFLSNIFFILWFNGKNKQKSFITDEERAALVAEIKHWMN